MKSGNIDKTRLYIVIAFLIYLSVALLFTFYK